jgi:hypothetical protein
MNSASEPSARVAGALHLFGAHNNLSGWYQSTAFSIVSLLWMCCSASENGTKKLGYTVGSCAFIYMSIGEMTNWDHGNWARLAVYVAPSTSPHIVLSYLGVAAGVAMGSLFWFMFDSRRPFLLSLLVYSLGAVGLELLSVETAMRTGLGAAYIAVTSAEELLEMLGCLLLLLATLKSLVPNTGLERPS